MILDLFHDGINEFQMHNVEAPHVCKCGPEVFNKLIEAVNRDYATNFGDYDRTVISCIPVEVDMSCEEGRFYFLSESDVKVHSHHSAIQYIEVPVLSPIGHCADEIKRETILNGQSLWSDSMNTGEKKYRGIMMEVPEASFVTNPEAERIERLKRQKEEGQELGNSQEIIRKKLLELRGMDSLL